MFHIIDFNGDGGKEKTVVPSVWLNKDNTLCILPPLATVEEIENLAQIRAQPKEGWCMYSVSNVQTFGNYAQAKETLEKIKRAASESDSEDTQHSKRPRRSHVNNHDTSSHDDDEMDDDSSMMAEVLDSSTSVTEESATNTDPLIVKVEPLSNSKNSLVDRNDLSSILGSNASVQLSFVNEVNGEAKCPCNSACHRLILQTLGRIQKDIETNNRLLRQLLGQQVGPSVPTGHCLPKDFPITLPAADIKDIEELDAYLQNEGNFIKTLPYFSAVGGNDAKQTLKRVMETLISVELGPQLNWKGRGSKKPFSDYTRIHSLVFNAVKQNPKSGVVTLSDVEKNMKDWLRFAPDRLGHRKKRRLELQEKILRC